MITSYGSSNVKTIILGTKSDLKEKKVVVVNEADALRLNESIGARFMEVSAKTGEGIEEAFVMLAR